MADTLPQYVETFELRPVEVVLFGTYFDFEFEEGKVAGALATAEGHTLLAPSVPFSILTPLRVNSSCCCCSTKERLGLSSSCLLYTSPSPRDRG